MKLIEKACIMRSFGLILVAKSMVSHKNSVSLRLYKICSLKRFIGCNVDNGVQPVITIGNRFILWHSHVLTMYLH